MCLQLLSGAQTWFMDGTFKTAPLLFKQIYITRANVSSSAVSCVYVFLQRKDQDTYNELFTELTIRAEQMGHYLDPDIIVTDFELAVANTIKIVIVREYEILFLPPYSKHLEESSESRSNCALPFKRRSSSLHWNVRWHSVLGSRPHMFGNRSFEKQFAWRT